MSDNMGIIDPWTGQSGSELIDPWAPTGGGGSQAPLNDIIDPWTGQGGSDLIDPFAQDADMVFTEREVYGNGPGDDMVFTPSEIYGR